jgi:hypothetical protein
MITNPNDKPQTPKDDKLSEVPTNEAANIANVYEFEKALMLERQLYGKKVPLDLNVRQQPIPMAAQQAEWQETFRGWNQMATKLNIVNDAQITEYKTFPAGHRKNAKAKYAHSFTIEGERYSFFARGWEHLAFVTDRIWFNWKGDLSGQYRNILPDSIRLVDKEGKRRRRGNAIKGNFPEQKSTTIKPSNLENALRYSPQAFDHDKMMGNVDHKLKVNPKNEA